VAETSVVLFKNYKTDAKKLVSWVCR